MNRISSDILNRQLEVLNRIMNPPYLAPKGCFSGIQEVSPGKIIEYESSLMPQAPVPLRFESALGGWEFIQFFKSTVETSTGIFKTMGGNIGGNSKTATEINYMAGGQSSRLAMAVDMINQKLIVPMVEKVADIAATFKCGSETVVSFAKGHPFYIEVDDEVRQSNYKYRYGDRKATIEKKLRFKELFEVVSSFSRISGVAENVNWLECFKYALEQYGIENTGRFLSEDRAESTI
jgi:hypothetical protein